MICYRERGYLLGMYGLYLQSSTVYANHYLFSSTEYNYQVPTMPYCTVPTCLRAFIVYKLRTSSRIQHVQLHRAIP